MRRPYLVTVERPDRYGPGWHVHRHPFRSLAAAVAACDRAASRNPDHSETRFGRPSRWSYSVEHRGRTVHESPPSLVPSVGEVGWW